MTSIYKDRGYENRADYLHCLAEDHDIPVETVLALASVLGPGEDFDGLVVAVEDESERAWE